MIQVLWEELNNKRPISGKHGQFYGNDNHSKVVPHTTNQPPPSSSSSSVAASSGSKEFR